MRDADFPRIKLDDLREEFRDVFDMASYVDVGIGWLQLVRDFVNEALPHDPGLAVFEIKEKWGGCRIWCDSSVLGTRLAKGKAEIKSAFTCEICGKAGYVRRPPPNRIAWWRCLCDEHTCEDQRTWPRRDNSKLGGMMQCQGQWYRYDGNTDTMVPVETQESRR